MVFLVFYGKANTQATDTSGMKIKLPLIALAVLSLIGGFVQIPDTLGGLPLFSGFLNSAFPATAMMPESVSESTLLYISAIVSLAGVFAAYIFSLYNPEYAKHFVSSPFGFAIRCFLAGGWNFDRLYNALFIRPLVWLAYKNRRDSIDMIYRFVAFLCLALNRLLSATQNGLVRRYALVIAVGVVIILGLVVLK
jgi:NADH-quinone oxidoreductase subunit L